MAVQQFAARLPTDLHERLSDLAAGADRSINAEIVDRLAASLGPDRRLVGFLDSIVMPSVTRTRPNHNTSADVATLDRVLQAVEVDELVLAARADPLNEAVLVALVATRDLTILMDHSSINMAREARQLDVADLLRALAKHKVLERARFARKLVPDTRELTPQDAAAAIRKDGNLSAAGISPAPFLKLLAAGAAFSAKRFQI
jgi:hypothetical protein